MATTFTPTPTALIDALRQLGLRSVRAARTTMAESQDKCRELIVLLQGEAAAKRKDTTYLARYHQRVNAWLEELTADQVGEINRALAEAAAKEEKPAAKPPAKEESTAKPAKPTSAQAHATAEGKRPKGEVFATIYDCLHRPDGSTKDEIRTELRKLEGSMETKERTLSTQLSRMGRERGFEITRTEVEGRGRVYKAVYPAPAVAA